MDLHPESLSVVVYLKVLQNENKTTFILSVANIRNGLNVHKTLLDPIFGVTERFQGQGCRLHCNV